MNKTMTREMVEHLYAQHRADLIQAMNLLLLESGLSITTFNKDVLDVAARWPNYWQPSSWVKELEIYRRTKPKRIELAFWMDQELLAVTLGHPTRHGTGLRLNLVQATPESKRKNRKMLPMVLTAYDLYAAMIGCNHIRVVNPLNEQLVKLYCGHGFSQLRRNPAHIFQTRKVCI